MSDSTAEFARTIIAKGQSQLEILVGRQWPEISRILEKDGDIKLSFSISISDREAEEGAHADKDNRIRSTIAFAEKFTDSVESALDAHPELNLDGGTEEGQAPIPPEPGAAPAPAPRKQRKPKTQNAEATTPLDQLLAQAAAGCPLPFVKCDLPEGDGQAIIDVFTEAAGNQGWPVAAISLLTQTASEADTLVALKQTIGAHVEPITPPPAAEPVPEPPAPPAAPAQQQVDPMLAQ